MSSSSRNYRVDSNGRAYAGSQRQIQAYVNLLTVDLDTAIRDAIGLPNAQIEWRSPLAQEGYIEYRDEEALEALGLSDLGPKLRDFWPKRGPCWDALANTAVHGLTGILLVEAKSHVAEMRSKCAAQSAASLLQIRQAFTLTKQWLGVEPQIDWMCDLYQSANRLAFLYLLRQVLRVPTWLVNIYFLHDPRTPTSLEDWKGALKQVKEELGLMRLVPYNVDVFLQAADRLKTD